MRAEVAAAMTGSAPSCSSRGLHDHTSAQHTTGCNV